MVGEVAVGPSTAVLLVRRVVGEVKPFPGRRTAGWKTEAEGKERVKRPEGDGKTQRDTQG